MTVTHTLQWAWSISILCFFGTTGTIADVSLRMADLKEKDVPESAVQSEVQEVHSNLSVIVSSDLIGLGDRIYHTDRRSRCNKLFCLAFFQPFQKNARDKI